jgi:hypothetical protein
MTEPGWVYIVRQRGTRYVKIGKTANLPQRLRAVERGGPYLLDVLLAEPVNHMGIAEDALQTRYSAYCVRRDWYKLPRALLADLRAQRALPGSGYSRVRAIIRGDVQLRL